MSSKCDICKHCRGIMCYHPNRVVFDANGNFVGMRRDSGQFDCTDNDYHFFEQITDNTQTLANALARVEELEKQNQAFQSQYNKDADRIVKLQSQRDRLIDYIKECTEYIADLENRISNEDWTRHQKEELKDVQQFQHDIERLIREIEGGEE